MKEVNCIIWDVDPVMFNWTFFSPRWYGFLFGIGIIFGYFFMKSQFDRTDHNEDIPVRLFIYLYFGAILGGFMGHRIFYEWDRLITDPLSTLSIRGGISGLSSHGTAIGVLISLFLFHLRTKIRYIEIVDRIAIGAAAVATMVRVGNLMNSEIVGRKTDIFCAFCFPRHDHGLLIPRHPSQIYEILIGLILLFTLILTDKLAGKEDRPAGLLTGMFGIVYFTQRFFVEFFKEYQALPSGSPVTMGQVLSVPFVLLGGGIIIWSLKTRPKACIVPEIK